MNMAHSSHCTSISGSKLSSSSAKNARSEEHTSELQSPDHLVCRLLLEKKKKFPTLSLLIVFSEFHSSHGSYIYFVPIMMYRAFLYSGFLYSDRISTHDTVIRSASTR